jgi:D-inositol-3-phosphate glycosyltransferase
MKISLLTGGDDPSYALPLASALTALGLNVDFIGNDAMQHEKAVQHENVRYLNLRGDQNPGAPVSVKMRRLAAYYFRLVRYATTTDSPILHILWLNKFVYFDRTILNLYYKLLGKKIVFTAHNINDKERDGGDTFLNRMTLRFMYSIVDQIFVHTNKMKQQLSSEFGVDAGKVTVIPFGINNHVPNTGMDREGARKRLGIDPGWKVALFFGRIAPYKGLDQLLEALAELKKTGSDVRLMVAGNIKKGHDRYWDEIERLIERHHLQESIIKRIEFIPDEDVELYCKAADVLILPYRSIFQTGVLFLSYNYGLPAIATDVGSLREEIIEGKTGYVCRPDDPKDLANGIARFFSSDLYKNPDINRSRIKEYAHEKYSWEKVGDATVNVYRNLSSR